MRVGELRRNLKQARELQRRRLTRGERVFAWSYTVMISLLAPTGILLLLFGGRAAHTAGIVLLVLAALGAAVPISPFLRARIRRREADTARRQR